MPETKALFDETEVSIENRALEIFLTYFDWGCGQIILDNLKRIGSEMLVEKQKIVKRIPLSELLDLQTIKTCVIIIDGQLISNWGKNLRQISENNPFSLKFVICKPEEDEKLKRYGLAGKVKKPFTPVQIRFLFNELEQAFEWMKDRT